MSLLLKTLGVFLAFSSTSVAPLIISGKGLAFLWVSFSEFKEDWGGKEILEKYHPLTKDYESNYGSCKVAVNWYYSKEALLFRCDSPLNYYPLKLLVKPDQKKDLFQEIIQYLNFTILAQDQKGYEVIHEKLSLYPQRVNVQSNNTSEKEEKAKP